VARVPYLSRSDARPDTERVWERVEAERKMPTANLFLALANAPELLDAFLSYANALRGASLDPKLRELAILTVGYATHSEYEIAHHQSHATKAGATPEQLAQIEDFESSDEFTDGERAIMRLAWESTTKVDVEDELWADAARYLSDRELVELALTIGWYNSGARIMALLGIELEASYVTEGTARATGGSSA
jgi:AhpD family alkylhydroperoxidase